MRVLVVVAALAWTLSARAQDCATSPEAVLAGTVIPAPGTPGVPTNITPIVGQSALELRLVGADGSDIPTSLQNIAVGGQFGAAATLTRLIPAGDLSPGEAITVVADGQVVTSFDVGNSRDDTAPAAPDATAPRPPGSPGDTGCQPAGGSAVIGVASSDAVLFIGVVNGQPAFGANARLDGASSSDKLVVFASGSVDVNVAAVDLAGNVSASVPVHVDVPAFCACTSSTSSRVPWALAVPALALAWVAGKRARR